MSEHTVTIKWNNGGEEFSYETYSRDHKWDFGNGTVVEASAAAGYFGNGSLVDPEQSFVASLSSCHMLTFLAIACKKGYTVDSYEDSAKGILGKSESGKFLVTEVVLSPKITFKGEKSPTAEELERIHGSAHKACFIANSVKTEIKIKPR